MNRFLPLLFFYLSFGCFAQKNDTVRIEKDPLVITHKVYVLEQKERLRRSGLSFMVIPQAVRSTPKQAGIQVKNGKGLSIRIMYELERGFFRSGIGIGAGAFSVSYTKENTISARYETSFSQIDTLESYYKIINGEKVWTHILDTLEKQQWVQRNESFTSTTEAPLYFIECPIYISIVKPIKKWELAAGIEGTLRKNSANSLSIDSWNLVGSVFGSLGYRFSETWTVSLSPRFGKDVTPTSDRFQNSYLLLALSSSFFW